MWTNERCSGRLKGVWMHQTWVFVVVIVVGSLLMGCAESDAPPANSEVTAPDAAEPAAETAEPATVGDLFPEGPARSLVLDSCGSCHAVACSAIGQRTAARWDNLKEDHRDKVSNLPEEKLEAIFAYLTEHFNDSKPEPKVPPDFLAGGCTPF